MTTYYAIDTYILSFFLFGSVLKVENIIINSMIERCHNYLSNTHLFIHLKYYYYTSYKLQVTSVWFGIHFVIFFGVTCCKHFHGAFFPHNSTTNGTTLLIKTGRLFT